MKLKQINFVTKVTPTQRKKLKDIIPNSKIKENGKILVKQLNKHFDCYNDIQDYKKEISKKTGIKITNILLVVSHEEEFHNV